MNSTLSKSLKVSFQQIASVILKAPYFKSSRLQYRFYRVVHLKRPLHQHENYSHQKKIAINISKYVNIHSSTIKFSAITVKAPSFPDSIADGDLRWKKKTGDLVKADEIIAEIETDKVALPVAAPSSGIIKELMVQEGAQVKSEAPLCTIEAK